MLLKSISLLTKERNILYREKVKSITPESIVEGVLIENIKDIDLAISILNKYIRGQLIEKNVIDKDYLHTHFIGDKISSCNIEVMEDSPKHQINVEIATEDRNLSIIDKKLKEMGVK